MRPDSTFGSNVVGGFFVEFLHFSIWNTLYLSHGPKLPNAKHLATVHPSEIDYATFRRVLGVDGMRSEGGLVLWKLASIA